MKAKNILGILFIGLLMAGAALMVGAGDVIFQDGTVNATVGTSYFQDVNITNCVYVGSAGGSMCWNGTNMILQG
ncbi:MAG TPA: hypothetical protein VJA47_01770 [archaeon]|nr:hypothetical protein [archaeon]